MEVRGTLLHYYLAKIDRPVQNSPPDHIQIIDALRDEMRHSRLFLTAREFGLFLDLTSSGSR